MGISLDAVKVFSGIKVTTTSVPPDSRGGRGNRLVNFAHGRALLSCRVIAADGIFRHAAAVILDGQLT